MLMHLCLFLLCWISGFHGFTRIPSFPQVPYPHRLPSRSTNHFQLFADKIRIRLTADVPGVGKKGEITLVTPAHFSNSLQPKRLATKISDEEMARIQLKGKERIELAETVGKRINSKEIFSLKHKMGPNGQLFGSISMKEAGEYLLTEIYSFDPRFKELKGITIGDVYEYEEEKETKGAKVNDFRKKGLFVISLKIHPNLPPFDTYLRILPADS